MRFKIASVNTGKRLALEKWDSRAPSDFPFIIYLVKFKTDGVDPKWI